MLDPHRDPTILRSSEDVTVPDYKNQTDKPNVIQCDYGNKPGHKEVCAVDVNDWDPCTSEENFDYLNSRPCVFIKLNKVGLLLNLILRNVIKIFLAVMSVGKVRVKLLVSLNRVSR